MSVIWLRCLLALLCVALWHCSSIVRCEFRPEALGHLFDSVLLEQGSRNGQQIACAQVLVVHKNRLVFERGYGFANRNASGAPTVHSVFNIGGISNTFVSSVAGVLVEEGACVCVRLNQLTTTHISHSHITHMWYTRWYTTHSMVHYTLAGTCIFVHTYVTHTYHTLIDTFNAHSCNMFYIQYT